MAEKTCAACDCKLDANFIKVTIGGRIVEVCCDDCAERLKEAHSASSARTPAYRGVRRRALEITAVSAFGLLSVLSLARAAAVDAPPTERVRYADLDLSKPAGVETLYRRLSQAAGNVCGSYESSHALDVQHFRSRCVEKAMADAVKDVGNPALTARFLDANRGRVTNRGVASPRNRTTIVAEER